MEKRRILVISYYYAPRRKIASLRWSKLVKYITGMGWEADVLTTSSIDSVDSILAGEISRLGNIIYIDHKNRKYAPTQQQKELLEAVKRGEYQDDKKPQGENIPVSVPIKKRSGFSALKHRIGVSAPVQFYFKRRKSSGHMKMSKDFAKQAEKYIRNNGGLEKYDAVVSTYGPVADVLLAVRLKKLYPDVPLIMDFRDPMDMVTTSASNYRQMHELQRQVCLKADGVCAVSNGFAESISQCCSKEVNVISNGYDRDDAAGIEPYKTGKLTMCYTGSVYIGYDDFTPLWKCIKELSDSGKIDLSRVEFVYAGTNGEYISDDMAKFGVGGIFLNRGKIERAESLRLQKSADCLVMSRWNTETNKGILSGKLFEYLLAGKPIIALVSGDLGGSELRSVIEDGRLGAVYEAASAEKDNGTLRDYILKLYEQKFCGVPSDYAPDRDLVDSLDYRSLAGDYMKFIENVIDKAKGTRR